MDHCNKIKAPDSVVKDLISKKEKTNNADSTVGKLGVYFNQYFKRHSLSSSGSCRELEGQKRCNLN